MLCLLLVMPITCIAAENEGTIRLKMRYNGNTVPGGTVVVYDVSACPGDRNPKELEKYVKQKNLPGECKQIDGSGTVEFDNLATGVYLLTQKVPADGYLAMNPFCVSIPISVNGQLIYEIDASPKLEPEHNLPQTGQLIWPVWAFIGFGLVFIGIGLTKLKME